MIAVVRKLAQKSQEKAQHCGGKVENNSEMWSMSLPYERHTKGVHTEKPQQVSHWSRKTPSKPSQNQEAPDSQTLHNSLLRRDQQGEGKAVHSKIEEFFEKF